tara:strand:- start:1642 stop:1833 length:192 start_codon:yes stop_codon:yes gene_type:complete
MNKNYFIAYLTLLLLFSDTAFARCAVCYTNGMSGASIAVIVIVTSFIVLFFANKFLQKILNKN